MFTPNSLNRLCPCLIIALIAAVLALFSHETLAQQAKPVAIRISAPGPGNLPYLPVELASAIGADQELGAKLQIRHVAGGGIALRELMTRKVSFALAGLPAVLSEAASGSPVVAIAAIGRTTTTSLVVRSDLKKKIRSLAELRGHSIGVTTGSLTSKTAGQQLAELLLRSAGVKPEEVRFVPAGQSWESGVGMLKTRTIDALIASEPFASRLVASGEVFVLADTSDPALALKVPGLSYLHAVLVTRADVLAYAPEKAALAVAVMKHTLKWIQEHTVEELAGRIPVADEREKKELLRALKKYPNLYSPDGAFSRRKIRETEIFFRAAFPDSPTAQRLDVDSVISDRFVGRGD